MRTGVVRVAGSTKAPTYATVPWKGPPNEALSPRPRRPRARWQVAIEDMALHPDGGNVADREADRGSGLDHQPRRNQLLHHHAGDRRAHGELSADGHALLFGCVDLLPGDPENLERLQAVLDVRTARRCKLASAASKSLLAMTLWSSRSLERSRTRLASFAGCALSDRSRWRWPHPDWTRTAADRRRSPPSPGPPGFGRSVRSPE